MMRKAQTLPAALAAVIALGNGWSDASKPTRPAKSGGLSGLIVSPIIDNATSSVK